MSANVNGPIVVGTDGSDTATKAVLEAIALAKAFDAPLHIVSAYKPISVSASDVPPEFADTVNSRSHVDAILDDVGSRARSADIRVEVHAVTGDPADAILSIAEDIDADLIVVGNKGLGSVKRFILGNVPSKIVHNSPCSTHVVHTV
jgi:nucleotide-binding universal stress UspA family protein